MKTDSGPGITPAIARACAEAVEQFGTPLYLYDEEAIVARCREVTAMPNPFGDGIEARFAMKANSSKALLQIIAREGLSIDASSLGEARRAVLAGIAPDRIALTTQEVPVGDDREVLETMIREGLRYNVCSLRQLELIADFASRERVQLAMRIHPGVGSGESSTRNTGDKYSCFGIHLGDIDAALSVVEERRLLIDEVHEHIGSGGDPVAWRKNIDLELGFVERYFPDATRVCFGGGLRVARMPGETAADLDDLGSYAATRIIEFQKRTGRKLSIGIEPGTYIVANAGYLVTSVIDLKRTGADGFQFVVLDGGMEVNARPLLYGSKHPFYMVERSGRILSSEFDLGDLDPETAARVVVGRCCESGDSQSLDETGHIVPRVMAEPGIGDLLVIGGCGAYCASMTPFNYNSHVQAPEVCLRPGGRFDLIRKRQSLDQIVLNEIGLADA